MENVKAPLCSGLSFSLTYSSYTKITTSRGCITYIVGLTFIFYRLKCKAVSTQTWEHTNHNNLRTLRVQKYNCIKASRRQQIKIGCRGDLHSKKTTAFNFFLYNLTECTTESSSAVMPAMPLWPGVSEGSGSRDSAAQKLHSNCISALSFELHEMHFKG